MLDGTTDCCTTGAVGSWGATAVGVEVSDVPAAVIDAGVEEWVAKRMITARTRRRAIPPATSVATRRLLPPATAESSTKDTGRAVVAGMGWLGADGAWYAGVGTITRVASTGSELTVSDRMNAARGATLGGSP